MEARIKFLGHPIHPMLIVFPLGLLATALVFDIAYVLVGNGDLATFSYWAIIAGVVMGLVAAVFGLADWLTIPGGTRAKRIGLWHGAGNVVVVAFFAASLFVRWGNPQYLPDVTPAILALIGGGIALVTAWLGGELVYRLRVAVDDDANLDAPSSLQDEGVATLRT